MANVLIRELTRIDGVGVFPVTISRDYQTIEWKPTLEPHSAGALVAFGYAALLFVGMLSAVLGCEARTLAVIGLASVVLYGVVRILVAVKAPRPAGEEKTFTAISIGFSVLYFALAYTVLTLVGIGVGSKQP